MNTIKDICLGTIVVLIAIVYIAYVVASILFPFVYGIQMVTNGNRISGISLIVLGLFFLAFNTSLTYVIYNKLEELDG